MTTVLFIAVNRARDGLPLSATTEAEQNSDLSEVKRYLKLVARKISKLPDRCSLSFPHHRICLHFISARGLSFMVLCSEEYPKVLAFCLLDEVQKEFIVNYDKTTIQAAVRPYAFIDFGLSLQKTKLRYNNTRSLSTKYDLANMSQEIKLRPPHRLTLEELGIPQLSTNSTGSHNGNPGGSYRSVKGTSLPRGTYTWLIQWLVLSLCAICGILNAFRAATIARNASSPDLIEPDDDTATATAFFAFLLLTLANLILSLLVRRSSRRRRMWTLLAATFCILSNIYLQSHNYRYPGAFLFHVLVPLATAGLIFGNSRGGKLPHYNV